MGSLFAPTSYGPTISNQMPTNKSSRDRPSNQPASQPKTAVLKDTEGGSTSQPTNLPASVKSEPRHASANQAGHGLPTIRNARTAGPRAAGPRAAHGVSAVLRSGRRKLANSSADPGPSQTIPLPTTRGPGEGVPAGTGVHTGQGVLPPVQRTAGLREGPPGTSSGRERGRVRCQNRPQGGQERHRRGDTEVRRGLQVEVPADLRWNVCRPTSADSKEKAQ